ncbi:MAG: hypothetical protein RJA70_2857 [Pseudomonadota bacterium]|jgi:hypothetical protein
MRQSIARCRWAGHLRTLVLFGACFTAAPASALEVSISAFAERGEWTRGYGGWLKIRVPWEQFAFSPVAQSTETPPPDEFADLDPDERSEEADPSLQAEEAPTSGETKLDTDVQTRRSARVTRPVRTAQPRPQLQQRVSTAPTFDPAAVRRMLNAALLEFTLGEQRMGALDSRAARSAWLPELRLKAGHNSDQTLRLTPTSDDPGRYQVSGAADLRLEAQATWKLHRLVFATEELAVERMRAQLEQQRQRRTEQFLDWLLVWRLADASLQSPDLADDERLLLQVKTTQAALALDVLTHGAFSRELARRPAENSTPRPAGQ